ncbi:DUF4304 domain-containing protein [Kineococcus xinjiangensis]|uniref:DUF4304 domain-containing protein n=1 Tax=Kineococcus xinjiangensis TaxID=512762 RepID=UPI001304C2DF|nr:DUF4304 domain-containing protein [Kineococcus xinjiangensis]
MVGELSAVFGKPLKDLGFRRRRRSWYRLGPALYSVLNLQASEWDSTVYLNLGFSPAASVVGDWLPERKCMVRFRAERILEVPLEGIRLLDGEALAAVGAQAWRDAVAQQVAGPVVGMLDRVVDLPRLRHALDAEVSPHVMVRAEVRQLLEVPRQACCQPSPPASAGGRGRACTTTSPDTARVSTT